MEEKINNKTEENNNPFMNSLSIIIKINKELEEDFNKNYSFNINILNEDIDKTIIASIFSLLNFQITIINQLTELNSQMSDKTDNILQKLISFTKELLYQKIKQILMFNHNNIIYKNYIDNSSSLKINNDKTKRKKKQIINLNNKNFIDDGTSIDNTNKSKIINKTLDVELNSINFDFKKNNIDIYSKKCLTKLKIQTPIKYNEDININNIKNINKSNIIRRKNIKINKNKNKKINDTVSRNYNKSNFSEKKSLTQTRNDKESLKNGKYSNKYIKKKTLDSILLKINDKEKEKEDINPITKVKNIIKNIKLNSSLSSERTKIIEKHNNFYSLTNNNYSLDSNSNNDGKRKNSFSVCENEKNDKGSNSKIIAKYKNNNISNKDIDTSQILYECMNNVRKRLLANENEKNNKQLNQNNINMNEYKTLKHYKIKKQLCMNLLNK